MREGEGRREEAEQQRRRDDGVPALHVPHPGLAQAEEGSEVQSLMQSLMRSGVQSRTLGSRRQRKEHMLGWPLSASSAAAAPAAEATMRKA